MNIALFGDLHGRVLLPFYLMARWQQEHGEVIEQALCTGDVGIYRGLHSMEPTSRRFAEKYPEELGFSRFFRNTDPASGRLTPHPTAQEVLSRTEAKLYFVPGNHEEHDYLELLWQEYARSLDEPLAVDLDWPGRHAGRYTDQMFFGHDRYHCLPQGRRVDLPGPLDEQTWELAYEIGLLAVNGLRRYTAEAVWGRSRSVGPTDILLTHETYEGRVEGGDGAGRHTTFGSPRLRDLVKLVGPTYHFFGHHHAYYPEQQLANYRGGLTRSVGLNQVLFHRRDGHLADGCFGILRVDGPGRMTFEKVEDRWLRDLRREDCAAMM